MSGGDWSAESFSGAPRRHPGTESSAPPGTVDGRRVAPRGWSSHPWSRGHISGAGAGPEDLDDVDPEVPRRPATHTEESWCETAGGVKEEDRRGGSPLRAGGGHKASDDEDDDDVDLRAADVQVVFAACIGRQGRLGIAYVDLQEPERILHVTDVLDPSFTSLQRLKSSILGDSRKGLCVVPARSPEEFVQVAAQPVVGAPEGEGCAEGDTFSVAISKVADFDLEVCRQRLVLLRLGGHDPAAMPTVQRELCGQAKLDLANEQLVRAAGGLARFLERNRTAFGDLDGLGKALHLHDLRLFSLDTMLFVDEQTMAALHVFHEDNHPSMIKGYGRAKEGVSVYGLLEPFVASPVGRATLRRWLQQPSRDPDLLKLRHGAVDALVRPRHGEFLRDLHREMREIRDVSAVLRRIFGAFHFDNLHDWRALAVTLEHMTAALGLVQSEGPTAVVAVLGKVKELAADVATAENMLNHLVDLGTQGAGGNEIRIRDGVDEQLDAVREQYNTIDSRLSSIAQLQRRELVSQGLSRSIAHHVSFHYFPQLGFQASVPNPLAMAGTDEDAQAMEELKVDASAPVPGWKYQFAGNGRLFYKCPLAERLDAEIGDLAVAARELELELLTGIVERLKCLMPRICRVSRVLGDLDVLLGFAGVAKQFGWTRPMFSKSVGALRIKKGRHPLVEATSSTHHGFVPNDTNLSGDRVDLKETECDTRKSIGQNTLNGRVQVVTGANLAGKSVYIKQVGIIVLLAQVGSFVPAAEAELGLCDFLFTRIQSFGGAATRCSTFGIDLAQVSQGLRYATGASLLLLDEFGKGTHAADGVALFGATAEYLCRWQNGPKAILTTHFTEIFRMELVAECEHALQLSHMRVLPPGQDGKNSVAYLYQLVPGATSQSFGIECARKAGLDDRVLQRAMSILASLEQGLAVPSPPDGAPRETSGDAEVRDAKQLGLCQMVIERLCALDPEDEEAFADLVDFASAHESSIRGEAVAVA